MKLTKLVLWAFLAAFLVYASKNPDSASGVLRGAVNGVMSMLEGVFGSDATGHS